ncbi:exodeoxyribonuclease V subunit beta [Caenimonas sedimenti]|uniref:RecBCD enzyme subunit RecB n=1 Tax=Caenimonas sedimenti TaxID=2596921 RepID=A0A562ZK06_9BURK|nr:exodeoxyribonuclease V subunit beta [Caenimonas sedimenti]TWO68656.1 exodeoxyribonuclease V subunit beta [Caenimonas sedimenti]
MTDILDPLRFALQGRSLIEASAGTGKTYTIAALYVRLVLGHGGAGAFREALMPPQILVVTFTEAATKELRDRIRARLAAAAVLFQAVQEAVVPAQAGTQAKDVVPAQAGTQAPADDFLLDLRASYPPAEWPACAHILRLAAEWMDEAAVSTIHGWCNRMLREHAFASGSLFSQALEADQNDLLDEAVRDYWRREFYALAEEDARSITDWWRNPAALRQALLGLLPHAAHWGAAPAPRDSLRQAREENEALLAGLKAPWRNWCDDIQRLLDAAVEAGHVDGRKLKKTDYHRWLNLLRAWCSGSEVRPALTATAWTRLTPEGLQVAWKEGRKAPDHAALAALRELNIQLAALRDAKPDVLRHAARWVAQRLQDEQERLARMGFDDLLTRLAAALQGPNGERLAQTIRAQFPVALIDEFQDTDPVQYAIFRAIYGAASPEGATALVLIGDPKQAIYSFRGADIHTYLAARRDTQGRHATLGTNYRSTETLVAAVNRFFVQAEERAQGAGAFLFRQGDDNPLPFFEVGAQGRAETWQVHDAPAPALNCWWFDPPQAPRPGDYIAAMATGCASEIVRLLQLGQHGEAAFAGPRGLRALQPGDIAVLVNTGHEARTLQRALQRRGVRSVYLSDRDNVYSTPAARELQRLLQACADPDDGRLLRAALGSALLALPWSALDELQRDEHAWEARLLQFRDYRSQWRRQGVLPMLRRLLNDFGVPRRLIAANDERQLTDVLHLAELLQQASGLLEGEHALVRHLAEQRQAQVMQPDERQLRLESDEKLVKVVTVHKSKGLEYGLVFVPFASNSRAAKATDLPHRWHDEEGRLQVSLSAGDEVLERVNRERLGEDVRKFYVALTRGRFATWVGLAPLADFARSAPGYLLAGGEAVPPGSLQGLLQAAFGRTAGVAIVPVPAEGESRYVPDTAQTVLAPEPKLPAGARERWWIASYSALRVAESGQPAQRLPASAEEANYLEAAGEEGPPPVVEPAPDSLHGFPRGASAGTFLHGVLEWAGERGFGAVASEPQEVDELIRKRCEVRGWTQWAAPLQRWLARWLATPMQLAGLPGVAPVRPADLHTIQNEMEFWFPADHVDALQLDALVTAHTLGGVARPVLAQQQLNGMLKGFMDLVFEHDGRYFVADYKSNRLGEHDADYTAEAMQAEVLKHRYELQYAIYLFALHRLLRSRIPDYDYDRHVGGAVYIFLRGHAAPTQGLHLERPGRALMDAMDRLFDGAGRA